VVKLREEQRALGVVPEPSDLTNWFKETLVEFDRDWKTVNGLDMRPRDELIKSEIFGEAQLELRAAVDTTITKELVRLRKAHAIDLGEITIDLLS